MAAATRQYAAGDSPYLALGNESRNLHGKRRRTLYTQQQRQVQ